MASYEAGSVTAKVILDTSEWNKAIADLKTEVKDLKSTFNSIKGDNGLDSQIKKLKEEISTLTETNENYKKALKKAREENADYAKGIENLNNLLEKTKQKHSDVNKQIQEETKSISNLERAMKREQRIAAATTKQSNRYGINALKNEGRGSWFNLTQGGSKGNRRGKYGDFSYTIKSINQGKIAVSSLKREFQTTSEYWANRTSHMRNAMESFVSGIRNAIIEQRKLFATKGGYSQYIQTLGQVSRAFGNVSNAINKVNSTRMNLFKMLPSGSTLYGNILNKDGEVVNTQKLGTTTQALKTFNFQILQTARNFQGTVPQLKAFEQRLTALAERIGRLNSGQGANWSGRIVGGYSQYISSITKINQALTRQAELEAKIKSQKLDQYYAKVGAAQTKYWNQIRQGTITLNTYKANITQINKKLDEQTKRTQRLASAQYRLFNKYNTTNLNTYKANMGEINRKLEEQTQNTRKAGRGITTFNNGIVQTAHSGRILSNTLYQIRGALLSLKMIFTAMGGMALWGFASQLAEGVKESFTAKNEMEAQLKQNKHVNSGGIEYFNNQLNELTKTFKKVNKYSIGETVSSIGLEFDLNSKEMADALDIVTMIQSEYVRAGRKESEAALAVKDILQGEFQRLSRETGVGKEELVAYGWDEDKTNIDGLLKALKKAALDRHWDIFAKKATSLNDVMTITKSRFSETGADIAQSATPLIVGAFNTLIDWIDNLQSSFNSLSSFWQHFTFIGGGTAIFGGILTALPMITKGMGLADIATIGWAKSVGTAVLNLNKAEVAQYGFRKALAAVIAGTKASELSEIRWTKAIAGRIMGVNQSVLAEKGWGSALVHNKALMKDGIDLTKTSILNTKTMTTTELTRSQKLAYLTNNIKLNEAAEMSRGKAILKTATSWKVLGAAIKGVMAIGIIAWLASVASWTDKVKGYINGLNEVWSNGKDLQKEAQDQVDTYTKQLDKYEKGTKEYIQAYRNLGQANANLTDIKKANELVKGYKKTNKELRENIKLRHQQAKAASYELTGMDTTAAKEQASGYASKVRVGEYYWTKSWEAYDDRLYKASQHTNEHIKQLQEVGVKGEELVRYVDEYNLEAENAATNWRKFNQGDFNAGLYAVLSEIKLAWIDISHHPEVVKLSQDLGKAFNDMKPSLKQISQMLGDFVIDLAKLADWLSQNKGLMQALPWAGLALGIGIVGKKLYGFLGGTKTTIDILKDLGGKLKDRIKDWRDYKDKVEDAKNAETGGTTTPTDETSKNSPKTWKKGEFWKTVGNDAKNIARNYAKVAVHLALAMGIVTEALLLLVAPMGALAAVGIVYKNLEPQIKQGVEGLKVIAPVLAVMLPPVVAIMFIMDKYKGSLGGTTVKGVVASVLGIAVGLLLVAEAIYMLKPSLWAIASLGDDYAAMKPQIENGKIAIQAVGDCLKMLVPFIPPMLVGVALMAAVFANPPIGIGLILTVVGGIALGMGLVAEAVYMLGAPLEAIGALGKEFNDLSDVKQGAEALKVTAEALGYVEQAMRAFTLIAWESLATSVATLIGIKIGVDLTQLTGEGGFFEQLETFTSEFNKIEITQIDTGKVETLKTSATGIDSVKTALVTVKDALKDLPNFEVDNRSPNQKYQDAVSGQETTSGITNYFEQLKQPIEQLNTFINNFNQLEISAVDPDKVATIQNSANFISTIKTAIDNVKTAVGSAVDTQWNANVQTSGLLGAGIGLLVGNAGQSSGIKGGLDELYNCVKDIMDFNTRINGLTSEGSGDTSGIQNSSNMVSALQTEITNLNTTLTTAVPTIKTNASGIGKAIVDGVKSGISNLSTDVGTALNTFANGIKSKGETAGNSLKDGFKDKAKLKDTVVDEVGYTFEYLDGQKDDFYNKGAALGDSLSQGFKDHKGLDQNSPGRMARAVSDELGFIGQAFSTGAGLNLPQMAANLAQTLSTNFNPSFTMGSLQLPNLDQFKQGLGQIPTMVTNVKTQVGTNFAGIQTSIGNSFNNIVSKTRLSLGTMLSATTKNIGSIRTSWKGMQSALIQSAENIKTQTGQKISKLKTNLGDFWNKIKHPDQLISGSAGGHTGTIHKRRGNRPSGLYAGGTVKRSQSLFKPRRSNGQPSDNSFNEYLKCLLETGSPCYAGGWNFNWTSSIQKKFTGWKTNFNAYHLDDFLNVGSFKNSNFPVKGRADIAKQYIFDVISGTNYAKYFNSNFGEDPVAALRAGAFNCWDGTNVIFAIARAFGFPADESNRGHGTWNGIGHVWANIPGLGIIDPTAIQNKGSFTSSAVRGYGSVRRGQVKRDLANSGETHNYGDIHITINNNGEDMTVNSKSIDNQTSKKIYDILRPSLSTGK